MRNLAFASLITLVAVTGMGCAHTVTINSSPPGADISVNGQPIGKAPVTYQETSSGSGTVEIKARLNGREVTQQVAKSEISWPAVGGVGAGGGVGACVGLNIIGGGLNLVGLVVAGGLPIGAPIQCIGCLALVAPLPVWLLWGNQMPDQVTINMANGAPAAPMPGRPEGDVPPPAPDGGYGY